jgi:hypothetical protein
VRIDQVSTKKRQIDLELVLNWAYCFSRKVYPNNP